MPGVSRTIQIRASREKIFKVITNYESYPQFLKEVKSVRCSDRNGPDVLVHYEVSMVKTIRYTLKMHETPFSEIRWSFHDGQAIKSNDGAWTLTEKGPNETEVRYQIDVTFGALVPKSLVNMLVDSSLPAMLEAIQQRAESA